MDLSSLIMGLFMIDFEKMSIEKQKKVEHLVKEIWKVIVTDKELN